MLCYIFYLGPCSAEVSNIGDLDSFRCEWLGESCTDDMFTETLTSKGACYTFNAGEDQTPYTISAAGTFHNYNYSSHLRKN